MVNTQERDQLHSQIKEQEKELEALLLMERKLGEEEDQSREKLKNLNIALAVSEKERDETQERVQDVTYSVGQLEVQLETISKALESETVEKEVSETALLLTRT